MSTQLKYPQRNESLKSVVNLTSGGLLDESVVDVVTRGN